jgi:hypothetical protein
VWCVSPCIEVERREEKGGEEREERGGEERRKMGAVQAKRVNKKSVPLSVDEVRLFSPLRSPFALTAPWWSCGGRTRAPRAARASCAQTSRDGLWRTSK